MKKKLKQNNSFSKQRDMPFGIVCRLNASYLSNGRCINASLKIRVFLCRR